MDTPSSKLHEIYKAVIDGMEKYLKKRFDKPSLTAASPIEQGKALTEFYVKDIALHTDALSDVDRIDDGLECDGSGDLNMDFIYKNPNDDEFWICQSKHKGRKGFLKSDEISGFFQIHERICDKPTRKRANQSVKDMLRDFNEKKSSATFVLLTNGKVSEGQMAEFNRQRDKLLASDEPWAGNFHWELVGLSEIKQKMKHADSLDKKPPSVEIPIESFGAQGFGKQGFIDLSKQIAKTGKDYQTIITAIRGTTLCNLWKRHRRSLFNYNIRGFLGKSKNKKLITTLKEDPGLFYLYNNGISAICTDLRFSQTGGGTTAHCEGFQIINGAQTVSSIGKFADDHDEENLKKVLVLARITRAEKIKSEKGLNKELIIANNTQNRIQDADFRSNDKFQVLLEKAFQEEGFQYCGEKPFKKMIYMPKRMYRKPRKDTEVVITMDEMAKSLYAFLKETPDKLNSQTKFLFDEDDNDGYWSIFCNDDGERDSDVIHASTARRCAAIVALNHFLSTHTSKLKKAVNKEAPTDKNDKYPPLYPSNTTEGMVIRSGRHILWAFGYLVREFYPDKADKIYAEILDGSAFGEEGFVQSWFEDVKDAMAIALESEQSDEHDLNFKMWLRDNSRLTGFKKLLRRFHTRSKKR